MKFIINRVVIAFLLVTLAGAAALGKSKKVTISFSSDFKVNGAVIKKGIYDVVFNEQTGELSIVKDQKVIAKTATRQEKRERKAQSNQAVTGTDGELASVSFAGSDQKLIVSMAGMQAGGN
jgi:IS4 transposase